MEHVASTGVQINEYNIFVSKSEPNGALQGSESGRKKKENNYLSLQERSYVTDWIYLAVERL
jgi:hypothetical protein